MDTGAENYRRFLEGDDDGLASIVREYKDALILFLCTFTTDVHAAEEICEDTFFRLMVKKPRFSGKSSFRSWLYSVAKHVAVDYTRRAARLACAPVDETTAQIADEADLERSYLVEERKIALRHALSKLSSDYAQALWLVYFEDFSVRETATAMKKSERQITNLLYRGKRALRTELEKEGFVYEEL